MTSPTDQTPDTGGHGSARASLLGQPKAVYAVAFACVISFMGIGLVDPILPALKEQLDATESEVTLLFTSYLVVTAVAMLVTNAVSSRFGAKRTLVVGLAIIVVFSALAGSSGSIEGIVAFRAGWGLGNALFISTGRSSSTRRRSASASQPAPWSAAPWATSAGAARSTASPSSCRSRSSRRCSCCRPRRSPRTRRRSAPRSRRCATAAWRR